MRTRLVFRATIASAVSMVGCAFDLEAVVADQPFDASVQTEQDGWTNAEDLAQEPIQIESCETIVELCASHSIECGAIEANNECGQHGIVSCGTCASGSHCEQGRCHPNVGDGCWPISDLELCLAKSSECGSVQTVDDCGETRNVDCGSCDTDAYCSDGLCIDYTYDWRSTEWSQCSANCDGGTRSRDVWCERDDSTQVADAQCTGTKPATSEACNAQACCTTATLVGDRRCDGEVLRMWFPWTPDTSDPVAVEKCRTTCNSWGESNGRTTWCCEYVNASEDGNDWACRVLDSHATHANTSTKQSFAGVGECQSP